MGREVRMVPAEWEHPKNSDGHYIPLHPRNYLDSREGWCPEDWEEFDTYEEYLESADEHYMPEWKPEEATHYMMYETCSEGTPISPAFETPEELARWLTETGASSFGPMTANHEAWLRVCKGGFACSAVYSPLTGLQSGVQALSDKENQGEKP